ncbi:M1 family metallopeptidase [Aquimarina sp. ERC-38]|uniref:M1 family metallopeptidase n=1 Tax=Aquimarina sp. ERC-38 TaxID=2949996 RepID=UPI0022473928|nr:M1 family metallopeptidase [Aquimarina sp. ERC-38]UZO79986.1 M1 family metallopeptidase [Aquimarina sp. ERC-38]
MKKYFILIGCCFSFFTCFSQQKNFTRQDTLRGSITPEREWWDLTYYHLDIEVNPDQKTIVGKNTVHYKVLNPNLVMQIDLQPPLQITKVVQRGKELPVTSEINAHFITLPDTPKLNALDSITVFYEGKPREAVRAPWDGGISWTKDKNGKAFVASSCQGLGASVWWPNKDHMYDEVDSMLISVKVPKGFMNVSNGRLRKTEKHKDGKTTFHWFVSNPINNYGVNINVGDYVHFGEKYQGEKGVLDMDYYVLSYNKAKAKKQFKDAPKMMEAFEHWFGPYPFYEDSFKLVEAPYLGMEHQSSVTYGNRYTNGYLGTDLSGTGWGLKFDFIIIHESGHEWFANNITYKDAADMWVHEGFTAYSENLFLDYYYGKEASAAYVIGTRKKILNDKPMIGPYGVNQEGSGDMYYKGANVLHTLRQMINDDEKWRAILRGLNTTFYHKTVTSEEIENYIIKESGLSLKPFFDQYLRTTDIPVLSYKKEKDHIQYKFTSVVPGFTIPVKIIIDGKELWITPTADWQSLLVRATEFKVDPGFYIEVEEVGL